MATLLNSLVEKGATFVWDLRGPKPPRRHVFNSAVFGIVVHVVVAIVVIVVVIPFLS